jgi:hypothetical protein
VPQQGQPLVEGPLLPARAAITASWYSPSFTFRIASRRCAPTRASGLESSGTGTTRAIDIAIAGCASIRCHVSL